MDQQVAKVALAYGFLGSNLGDVAITKGALAALRSAGVRGKIKVISRALNTRLTRGSWERVVATDPDLVFQAWDHTFASFRGHQPPSLDFVHSLARTPHLRDAIFSSAGLDGVERLYYSGGENLFSHGSANDDWNLLGRLSLILVARAKGVRTGFLPCTFGPFETDVSRRLIQEATAGADFVMVRDSASPRYLTGVPTISGADGAFFTANAATHTAPPSRWGKRIALVPRLEGSGLRLGPDRSRGFLAAVEEGGMESSTAFQLYLAIGRRLLSAGRFIRLLTQCDADVELNRALFDALTPYATADNQVALSRPGSLMAYHRVLATCGGVITSRLHSAIFALQNGLVPIALYYDSHGHKTPGLFSLLGLEEYCLPADEFEVESLIPMIARARAAAAEPRVADALNAARARTIETIKAASASHEESPAVGEPQLIRP